MVLHYQLTNLQGRQLLLHRHGLLGSYRYQGKAGVLAYVQEIGALQYDPLDICGRTADITLQSRIKDYHKTQLVELLYEDRQLIDYFDKNLGIFPLVDFPKFHYYKEVLKKRGAQIPNLAEIEPLILAIIQDKIAVTAKDFEFNNKINWDWGQNSVSRAALEAMYQRGDLLIHHKEHNRKSYTLPELVLRDLTLTKPQNPFTDLAAFHTWMVARRLSNVGFLWNKASDAWLGIPAFKAQSRLNSFEQLLAENLLIELQIEGIDSPLFLAKKDQHYLMDILKQPTLQPRMELIAPLDALIWDRKLIKALFDFEYKWEVYTPVAKRQYGHYVLPILYGNQFIGRIELKVQRKTRHLQLVNYWLESGQPLTPLLQSELTKTLQRFAVFNDCLTLDPL